MTVAAGTPPIDAAAGNDTATLAVAIGVRALAEFVCREGDIHRRYDAPTEAREGIRVQQMLQRDGPSGYERERRVTATYRGAGVALRLSGRVDGCDLTVPAVVDEFKATRQDADALHAHLGAMHEAQLRLYAAMLARETGQAGPWCLRLIYCHPDTLVTRTFETRWSTAALAAFFEATCAAFCRWVAGIATHRRRRNRQLADVAFPHPDFRDPQRRLARHTFRTLRDGGQLWVEAPTGIGKSLGTLFPALKAMAGGHLDRIVFLSSRGTGQPAAANAVKSLGGDDNRLRTVTVTARDKICFMPEPVCDPAQCSYARGYYDRRHSALETLFTHGMLSRPVIEAAARRHHVCPFELSLDAAVWADVVICDYNYLFDPVVQLQRIRGMLGERVVLLIDEAHQLPERVRDMLSAELRRDWLRPLTGNGGRHGAGEFRRLARTLERQLLALRRAALASGATGAAYRCEPGAAASLARPLAALLAALQARPAAPVPVAPVQQRLPAHGFSARDTPGGARDELLFRLLRFQRALGGYDDATYLVQVTGAGSDVAVELRCLDPAPHIAAVLRQFPASVAFSATLTPLSLFHRLQGLPEARTLRVPSPFSPAQLAVHVVPDIDTRYRARGRSVGALATLIAGVAGARTGNYLVALPSFEYLTRVVEAFQARHPSWPTVSQTPAMDAVAREAFLDAFRSGTPVLGFAVLGGVFTESIDLPGDALIGMIVVGPGLPPPSLERDHIATRFRDPRGFPVAPVPEVDATGQVPDTHEPARGTPLIAAAAGAQESGADPGYVAAYQQPAMTRVVQAAGRLIRTEQDRGVLCLVDDRFRQASYQRFFPVHWRVHVTPSKSLRRALDAFWNPG